jgi:DNA-binding CsgD family transcriptional regulator
MCNGSDIDDPGVQEESVFNNSSIAIARPVGDGPPWAAAYEGPDRRNSLRLSHSRWIAAALEEIDYGLVLLDADGTIAHINHSARAELDSGHPLQLQQHTLRARLLHDATPLQEALAAARLRGLRRLLSLGEGGRRVSVSIVPLTGADTNNRFATLLMFGKRSVSESLSLQGFARCHGLTAAETRILSGLCRGEPPNRIAQQVGVAISTVRTQIGSIRQKTGAQSIRDLMQQIAVLPPLMGVLR